MANRGIGIARIIFQFFLHVWKMDWGLFFPRLSSDGVWTGSRFEGGGECRRAEKSLERFCLRRIWQRVVDIMDFFPPREIRLTFFRKRVDSNMDDVSQRSFLEKNMFPR